MVQMKVYIGKTYVEQCFGTNHHFRAPKSIRVVPSESEKSFSIERNYQNQVPYDQNSGLYRILMKIIDFLKFF